MSGSLVTDAGQTIVSGALPLALGLAALAGLVSFASPCVLPLVPGYLGYIGGAVAPRQPAARVAASGAPESGAVATEVAAIRITRAAVRTSAGGRGSGRSR